MPEPAADLTNRIAQPGDSDLDCHLTGLRIASLVILDDGTMTNIAIDFDTSEAAGSWTDAASDGELVIMDRVSSVELNCGLGMQPGYEDVLTVMIQRLDAWRETGAPITMTMAPRKWTLLYSPGHPAGECVPIPRTGALKHRAP